MIQSACLEQKKRIALAMSSGWPHRPSGMLRFTRSLNSGPCEGWPVTTGPGATAFTVFPCGATSRAMLRVYASIAALLAPYDICLPKTCAQSVLMLTTRPHLPFRDRCRFTYSAIISTAARVFTSKCRSNGWLLFSRDQPRVPVGQVSGDQVSVLVTSGRRRVDLDIVDRAVVQVLVLPTGPSLVVVDSFSLPLLQDVKVAVDANVAQAVAAEDREGVGYAVALAVGQHPIDDDVETLIGEASDGPMKGPVHRDGKAAVSNVVRKVREEAVGAAQVVSMLSKPCVDICPWVAPEQQQAAKRYRNDRETEGRNPLARSLRVRSWRSVATIS